ncbi:MAG: putative toxin-antitoxin system toxin component, PIN family [Terriglobia bacterium]
MLPLRLVLDTNVVVPALLKPGGLERTSLIFALTPPARWYLSPDILAEYQNVLLRPRLRLAPSRIDEFIELAQSRALLVNPSVRIEMTPDPDDNIFLECADDARADYLVTGNKRHFPRFWKATKIINVREFIEVIAPHLPL